MPEKDVQSSLGSRIVFNAPVTADFIVLIGAETYTNHNKETHTEGASK